MNGYTTFYLRFNGGHNDAHVASARDQGSAVVLGDMNE